MILRCDNQELPAPVSIKVDDEIIWSSSTGRALDGTMLGDVVAEKKTLSISWGVLQEDELVLIKSKLVAGFFPITFHDDGQDITITSYRGTLSKEVIGELNDISNLEIEVEIMMVPMSVLEMCDTEKYDTPTSKEMAALEFMIGE